jgi:hypothetical protein
MEVGVPLVADGEASAAIEPSDGALDDPAMATERGAGLDTLAGDAAEDAPTSEVGTAASAVVGFVGVELAGPGARAAGAPPLDRVDTLQDVLEDDGVVDVRGGQEDRQWEAIPIDDQVALRAGLAPIGRIRPGLFAPFFAGTLALSRLARLQSICPAPSRRSRIAWWIPCQTPACSHSDSRRQHVIPHPQPISCGRSSHASPVFNTKTIPVRHARSGTRGRPPFGFGGSGGISGSTISHNSSGTSSLLMPAESASSRPRFC